MRRHGWQSLVLALAGTFSIWSPARAQSCDDPDCGDPACGSAVECGDGVACGAAGAAAKPNPCATAFKGVFYNNDFSYLKDPNYNGDCFGDGLKLMPVAGGEWGTLDIGGQLRARYHHEEGMGQDISGPGVNRFQGTQHDIFLSRMRLYGNWKASDHLRFFCEGIFADVTDDAHTYLPRPIDRNFGDFLNAFVDVGITDSLTARLGRQELLYGEQRLISPLDWANTRRTFDGARMLYKGDGWSSDLFYTYYVPVIPNQLDEPDYDQVFYGSYNTFTVNENLSIDAYYIGYDDSRTTPGSPNSDFSLHTCGLRLNGALTENWLFEMEGGPQFGRQSGLGLNQDAGFYTAGIGRKLGDMMPWTPTLWCYYDYASGNAGGGDFNRFNDLFPLGHKYLGFIDAARRQNIEAPNVLLTMKPHQKVEFLFWYWHIMADQAGDIVPSIGGTPAQSTASKDFGDELDIIAKYVIGPRSNVLIGYSHFWRGNKILAPADADFTYVQWEQNF
jgi:Alginate export